MVSDSRSDDDYGREVQELLAGAVRDEVAIAFGIEGLDVTELVVDNVSEAVASRIDYAFRFRWDPSWVKDGAHQWEEEGRCFARCTTCLAVSPGEATPEAASRWHRSHASEAHGG